MKVKFKMDPRTVRNFTSQVNAVIRNVDTGTKRATDNACKEILKESLAQVPRETNTLADSAEILVRKRADISSYRYEGLIFYGGNGDPINPVSGKASSEYALVVHEDFSKNHLIGKAKYLEDPIKQYGVRSLETETLEQVQSSINGTLG